MQQVPPKKSNTPLLIGVGVGCLGLMSVCCVSGVALMLIGRTQANEYADTGDFAGFDPGPQPLPVAAAGPPIAGLEGDWATLGAPLSGGQIVYQDNTSLIVSFEGLVFTDVQPRFERWLGSGEWTLVPGSITDQNATAEVLEDLGQSEAAALARQSSVWGGSWQRFGTTLAVGVSAMPGQTLQVSLSKF
jgi:hypothetical protein